MKKKKCDKFQSRMRYASKPSDSSVANYTCFGCGNPRHIKMDCPSNHNKEKAQGRKADKG